MALDGWRRLRRVPGGAAGVGADVAGRRAPGGATGTPAEWRSRWESEASAFGTPGMPAGFEDPPNAGQPILDAQAAAEAASHGRCSRGSGAPCCRGCVREAEDRGWWSADAPVAGCVPGRVLADGTPTVRSLDAAAVASLAVAPRTVSPFDPVAARSILVAAARDGARVVGAVAGSSLVGVAVADPDGAVLALGVAPSFRRQGLGTALLRTLVEGRPAGTGMTAEVGVAERDWVEPLDVETRRDVARRLLTGAGFEFGRVSPGPRPRRPVGIAARLSPALSAAIRRRAAPAGSASRARTRRGDRVRRRRRPDR